MSVAAGTGGRLRASDPGTAFARKRKRSSPMQTRLIAGFLAGAAALAAGLGGVPAQAGAAPTWTVSPGGSATAKATAGTITLTDTSTGAVGTCASSTATGTVKKG